MLLCNFKIIQVQRQDSLTEKADTLCLQAVRTTETASARDLNVDRLPWLHVQYGMYK